MSIRDLLIEASIIYEDDPEVPIEELPGKLEELKSQLPELKSAKRMVARMRMENSELMSTSEDLKGSLLTVSNCLHRDHQTASDCIELFSDCSCQRWSHCLTYTQKTPKTQYNNPVQMLTPI